MDRDDVPSQHRNVYDRAMRGKSRKAAVRCYCLMCVGWSWDEVRKCSAPACPLYLYRLGGSETKRLTPPIEGEVASATATDGAECSPGRARRASGDSGARRPT